MNLLNLTIINGIEPIGFIKKWVIKSSAKDGIVDVVAKAIYKFIKEIIIKIYEE
jgi:hypothetical protein